MWMRFALSLFLVVGSALLTGSSAEKVPVIFDNDANYDDTLALMYLASNPMFDLKAVTTAGAGFATHHGGPINMQQVLQLFDSGMVPTSYGKPTSLSPISTFPLQWRIEIDEFFMQENLTSPNTPLSAYPSDQLIAKVLKESTVAVAVVVTGPATNLALALQKEPELVERISGLFLMGSNYGGGPNNVYDWQMQFNGVWGSCSEDPLVHIFTPNEEPLVSESANGTSESAAMREGCRGNSMSESGDTEWNVFLDAVAWHVVTRIVADSAVQPQPPVYVITSGATEEMPITMVDFEEGTADLPDETKSEFINDLAAAFLGAGEAKWWDAQLVVAMADVIAGKPIEEQVCSEWLETSGFKVNLQWKSIAPGSEEKNPYGSITDVEGIGPVAYFCRHGNVTNMQDTYWSTLAAGDDEAEVAEPDVYLREISSAVPVVRRSLLRGN